jgi:arginase
MWFDQHGDFNTPETSAYGFLDGMALACVVGRCWRPMTASVDGFRPVPEDRTVLVDARDLDPDELVLLGRSAITRVATDGAAGAAQTLRDRGTRSCHLHLDLDVHDPADLRVNQYAAPGGPTRAALREAVCRVAVLLPLAGMTVSAYDPALDRDAAVPEAVADLLVECLATMDGCHA